MPLGVARALFSFLWSDGARSHEEECADDEVPEEEIADVDAEFADADSSADVAAPAPAPRATPSARTRRPSTPQQPPARFGDLAKASVMQPETSEFVALGRRPNGLGKRRMLPTGDAAGPSGPIGLAARIARSKAVAAAAEHPLKLGVLVDRAVRDTRP